MAANNNKVGAELTHLQQTLPTQATSDDSLVMTIDHNNNNNNNNNKRTDRQTRKGSKSAEQQTIILKFTKTTYRVKTGEIKDVPKTMTNFVFCNIYVQYFD